MEKKIIAVNAGPRKRASPKKGKASAMPFVLPAYASPLPN